MTSSERAAAALEWDRFLNLAIAEARTELGKNQLARFKKESGWTKDLQTALLLQQETQEASQLLDRDALWGPLLDLFDPSSALEKLEKGGILELVDLVLIRKWLYAIDSWSQSPREEIRGELFRKALSQLTDPYRQIHLLDRILTPEGELSERASPRLAALYAEIRSLKREIGTVLDHLMKTLSTKGVLQENFTDVRDGRYVLPVKISSQGEIDGIIYEASASRQTVFVEPREVAPLNNRLRQRQNELLQEIYRVLTETSDLLRPDGAQIGSSVAILGHWDGVQARARFGLHYGGKPILVTDDRLFLLHQTAHPLLWKSLRPEQIIRNQLDFGEPTRTLLLTGPNTGGKTVLLKTLGLAALCARTGFPFPGTDHPTVPFFHTLFADLGDPQSIEEHLSSFSGHIMRFKEILDNMTGQSLVLIDELNSATDPEEGAALGRAFLETVMSSGAMVVTTTHDPHLKALAVSDERIVNASMQFDEGSRSPTYKMIIGVPGRSRALETADRLGLPPSVVDLARQYLSTEHKEFERLLAQLESDIQQAASARKEAVQLREEAERLKKEWTQRTEKSVSEMLDRTRQKLRKVIEQAQDEVRSSVRKLDEASSRRELDNTRAQLSESAASARQRIEDALSQEAPDLAETLQRSLKRTQEEAKTREAEKQGAIEPGTSVRIPKWKNTGTVLSVHGGKIKVAMGNLQMTLSLAEVEPIAQQPKKQVQARIAMSEATPEGKLDLRGRRLDDAMTELEHYLDLAYRSGMVEVVIIHGFGTGAIREGARKVISSLPYIKSYRDGGPAQGGAGATVIEFDRA